MSRRLQSSGGLRRDRGISLVEIMVALVIGMALTAGMIQLFVVNKQTYRSTETLSRLQENGRFAIEILQRDIRMAGFTGCPAAKTVTNLLNGATTTWWENFAAAPIRGYEGSATFPGRAVGSLSGDRIAGTDAVTLLQAGGDEYWVLMHNVAANQITLDRAPVDLQPGSLVLVCDTKRTAIFQLTGIAGATVTFAPGGTWTPGNTAALSYTFGQNARMVEFVPSAFYVGISSSGSGRSLYRFRLAVSGSSASVVADELVQEVENMQLYYGVDANSDNLVDPAYLDASAVTNWSQVLTIRIGLLLASAEQNLNTASQQIIFPSADTGVANAAGNSYTASDRRLYLPISSTVAMRNRLP